MSFRYTNSLVGALKHRLALESAHREIARRTFIGTCNGVEVTCSGYGSVLGIRLLDKASWAPFYARDGATAVSPATAAAEEDGADAATKKPATAAASSSSSASPASGLDYGKLSQSIKTAIWEANRLIRAAKEDAHARAVLHNPQMRAKGSLRDWYETDATSMHPRPFDALKQEAATPWMQAVRFAKANPDSFLGAARDPASGRRVTVLEAADCDPVAIPIGATHPLYIPSLTQLEEAASTTAAAQPTDAVTGRPNLSRVSSRAVLSEQRKEMSRDEEIFWERVELIRRGQIASIPNAANKRGYADMTSTVSDDVVDKVELKFTQ